MAEVDKRSKDVHHDTTNLSESDIEELMDSTDDIILGYEERLQQLEEQVLHHASRLQEVQYCSDQLTTATIDRLGVQDLKDEIDRLRGELRKIDQSHEAKVNELQAQVDEGKLREKALYQSIESLEAKVNELQAQVDELKQKLTDSERDRDKVYLCQIAVEFEQAICSHVLPEVFSKSNSARIDDLLNMLNSGDEECVPLDPAKYDIKNILRRARQRWDKVCEDLKLPAEWKKRTGEQKINYYHRSVPGIFRAMALLRHKRNLVAHPKPVSVQVAEEKIKSASMSKDLEEWQFKLVKDFILSLRANITRSGIQTDQERFKLD